MENCNYANDLCNNIRNNISRFADCHCMEGKKDIQEGIKDIREGLRDIREGKICEGIRDIEEGLGDIIEGLKDIDCR